MIDQILFNELKTKYTVISSLPDKLQDLISGELSPKTNILDAYSVLINGKKGCVLILEEKLIAFWMSKFLFKKFPTIQEFNYSQINELKHLNPTRLFIHSSAEPTILNENYEKGEFTFETSVDKNEASEFILSKATRLLFAE